MRKLLVASGILLLLSSAVHAQAPAIDVNNYVNIAEAPVVESGGCRTSGYLGIVDNPYPCHTLEPCDVVVTTATTPTGDWTAISGEDTVCIVVGDHTGRGILTIDGSGTSGDYRQYRCVNADESRAAQPWDTTSENQCQVRGIDVDNDDFIVIDRFVPITVNATSAAAINTEAVSDFIVLNGIDADCSDLNTAEDGCFSLRGGDDIWLQRSVCDGVERNEGVDQMCISVRSGASDRVHIVMNDLSDATHEIQTQNVSEHRDLIIENNDIYRSDAVRQLATGNWPTNQSDTGIRQCGEGMLIFKEGGNDAGDAALVIHNRFSGQRAQGTGNSGAAQDCGGTGSTAAPMISFSQVSSYVNVSRNIFGGDFSQAVRFLINDAGCGTTEICGNITIDANLFHGQIRGDTGESANAIHFSSGEDDNNRITFNGFFNGEDNAAVNYMEQQGDNEVGCNIMFDAQNVTGTWGAGSGVQDNNLYGGDTEAPAGSSNTSGLAAGDLDDYTYFRNVLTTPVEVTVTNAWITQAGADSLGDAGCAARTLTTGYGAE